MAVNKEEVIAHPDSEVAGANGGGAVAKSYIKIASNSEIDTLYIKRLSEMNRIIFIDQDNKSTILDDEEVFQRIRNKGHEELKNTAVWVVTRDDFPEKHLHGECVNIFDECYRETVSDKANAADFRIIRRVVELHAKLPDHIPFTIVSGDRAFETIMGECVPRRVIVTSPHPRHNHPIENIIEDMFPPPTVIRCTHSHMRNIINKLSGLQGLAKLYFINSDDLDRIPQISEFVHKHRAKMLLFCSQETKEKCQLEHVWFNRFIGDQCYIFETLSKHKKDAPLFKLFFCVLYLNYMPEESIPKSIQFEIISENGDETRDEINYLKAYSGRQVELKNCAK